MVTAVTVTGTSRVASSIPPLHFQSDSIFFLVCHNGVRPQTSSPSRPLCKHHNVSPASL